MKTFMRAFQFLCKLPKRVIPPRPSCFAGGGLFPKGRMSLEAQWLGQTASVRGCRCRWGLGR